jgi:hypothetical protein
MTQTLDALLSELEERAKAATPGPWSVSPRREKMGGPRVQNSQTGRMISQVKGEHGFADEADTRNAVYIASASPDTILKLVAVIRRMREGLELSLPGSSCFPTIQDKYSRYLMERQAAALRDVEAIVRGEK